MATLASSYLGDYPPLNNVSVEKLRMSSQVIS